MSTEEAEAGSACGEARGGAAITRCHTWDEGEPRTAPKDVRTPMMEKKRETRQSRGDLLNPCRCDGSVRYTHQHCLLKWISERGCWTCELCCYRFHVIAINMKRPWQWQSITITLVEKVQIIAVFLGSLFLVASISWLLWSALSPQAVWQRRDVLFQICYGMYGFMDLVCVGLIVHEGAAVYNVFMLACRQPPLGRSELRQGKGHGGDEHRPFLTVPQDAMVAPGHLRAQRPLTPHSAGATAMDLPLFGPFLPRPVAPKQPQPGQ
ncbi:E3 ubiquitin-protein ligase MARCH11 [Collichthys lucidus]|uniref:RING-type E3 ubiquitin transferase n=1 Tax=Collichthys lucidus TaxID=240159 RepID=A0A4U5UVP8_COLLU|nr:E3 ubiquitin-protein ligase MARCH11 [Collichthys lucidus]